MKDSDASLTNGMAIDPDQRHLYVSDFGGQNLFRLSLRPGEPIARVALGGRPDNVHWTPSGKLIVTVISASPRAIFDCAASSNDVCPMPFKIVETDPRAMKESRAVIAKSWPDVYPGATTAIWVGKELWISSFRDKRIVRYAETDSDNANREPGQARRSLD